MPRCSAGVGSCRRARTRPSAAPPVVGSRRDRRQPPGPRQPGNDSRLRKRHAGGASRENTQAGEKPLESISFKAQFSAADELNDNKVLARMFGVGPRLCALEKMVNPSSKIAGLIGAAIDAVGDAISGGGASNPPTQAIPREKYP